MIAPGYKMNYIIDVIAIKSIEKQLGRHLSEEEIFEARFDKLTWTTTPNGDVLFFEAINKYTVNDLLAPCYANTALVAFSSND